MTRQSLLLGGAVGLWLAGVGGGMALLARYKATPGEAGGAPGAALWPSQLPRVEGRAALLLFAHPRCTCTRATLEELRRLMERLAGRAQAFVYFTVPAGLDAAWAQGELWEQAARIEGVTPRVDPQGALARELGAQTSGHVLVYDEKGQLRFGGGITSARGHVGMSLGGQRILALLSGERPDRPDAPTFGCALTSPEEKHP